MDIERALELEAGETLDVFVAELLGENVQHAADFAADDKFFGGKMFCSDREWYDVWIWDDKTHTGHPIPPYSTDANAALSLPREGGVGFELNLYGDTTAARFSIPSSSRSSEAFPTWYVADAPALATVRAWLAHHAAVKR